ncbi:MAG: Tex-like N-terminal domain-containing protein [Candidatus Gracilibacteria bacterium]|nr:Tex-like N-terminal domain-containing protein [Candidatus Gracilibacteria bacterium]
MENTNENNLEENLEIVEQEVNNFVPEVDYIKEIANELGFKDFQVKVVLDLVSEGSTVPFIARYKKEVTGNLDEDQIREIIALKKKLENLFKAKVTATNGINALGKLTPELLENILKAKTLKEVEEIYKPYKSKKKTKAMIAIEKGFQVIADEIKKNKEAFVIPENLLNDYSREEIIEGSINIIGAEVSANSDLRADLIDTLTKYNEITSKIKTEKSLEKLNEKDRNQIPKFDIYSDFSIKISYIKPYQVLALNRGENLGILNVKIQNSPKTYEGIAFHYARILKTKYPFISELEAGFKEGYDALFTSVENEVRGNLAEIAEDEAIETFKSNLSKLLMTKPEYGKKILAIDPGFNAGCKMAILDEFGNPLSFEKIFLHKKLEAKAILKMILEKEDPKVIVVGNGTGVNETIDLLNEITKVDIYIVNESGASVYSASKTAQEEFPELDSLDRGTVSIGRRFIDPLSELVKVPVGSIGVGMYQHDVPEKKLEEKLGFVVEDRVNDIGINVNTASSYVLNYISGIDKKIAKKIYNNRPYKSRAELKKQLSAKSYEQAIGFLRVPESSEKLDNSDIHPDQYNLAKYVIENNIKPNDFTKNKDTILSLYKDANETTIEFIIKSYNEIGVEKRVNSAHQKATSKVDVKEIKEGSILKGVVRNVLAFGAFIDIGTKNDGLVHISQITDRFIKDPKEVLEVGQSVVVKVLNIDEKTLKIQLSMKGLN